MKFRAAILCLLFFCAVAIHAQAPPAEKIDPAKEADIRRMIQITQQSINTGDFLRQMMGQIREITKPMQKDMPPEERERLDKFMDRLIEKMIPRMQQEMERTQEDLVAIYAKHFTHDEIKAIVQFYESPAGKKMLAKMPEIMRDTMAVSMPRLQQMQKEMMEEMMADLRKEFPDVPWPKAGTS